jgi:hypothetical protein
MDLVEIGLSCVDWIGLAQDRHEWRAFVNEVMNLRQRPESKPAHLDLWAGTLSARKGGKVLNTLWRPVEAVVCCQTEEETC